MTTKIKDVGNRIMNDHGVYPLLDDLTNAALLQTVCDDVAEGYVYLYADAKGFHLIWRQVEKDKNGDAILNGGNLPLDTKSVDVTAEFAAKLDYDGAAPDFNNTAKADNNETWFITSPKRDNSYTFTLYGIKDSEGTHLSHVFATDGEHSRLLLAPGYDDKTVSLEHTCAAMALNCLFSDEITRIETDADILSKAKELLK